MPLLCKARAGADSRPLSLPNFNGKSHAVAGLESFESSPAPDAEKLFFPVREVYPPPPAAPSPSSQDTEQIFSHSYRLLLGNPPLSPESRCSEVRKLGYLGPERKSNLELGSNAIPDQ